MRQEETQDRTARMERNIERQIVHRTWGRVHRLRVEVREDRVVVHGMASSYYVKQLALEGAMDVLEDIEASRLELDIDVSPARVAMRDRTEDNAFREELR